VRDAESAALEAIFNALRSLDEGARARVLAWVVDRFVYGPPQDREGAAPAQPPGRGAGTAA
jgi:hypothetical protein